MDKVMSPQEDLKIFNQVVSRAGTHAEKYELRQALFGTEAVLPMWVADMDITTPQFIREAIQQRLDQQILGYTAMPDSLYQAIIGWQAQHDYSVQKSHILFTHNVANGFFMAVSAFTEAGDAVLVQPPIYPPFLSAPTVNQRQLVEAPLALKDGRYEIDFIEFEAKVVQHNVKLFLFCNPQNPSGRVWRRNELMQLAAICLKHNVLIVSDEIHSDLVFAPYQHVPMASLSQDIANITVTLSSPGKTFNLGGLQVGYAIIANPTLKAQYRQVCQAMSIHDLNVFGAVAVEAAYSEQGKQHRNQLLKHLHNNIQQLSEFLNQYYPAVKVMQPEASYLVWLDFSKMFDSQAELKTFLIEKAKLGLNDGESFGEVGKGFMRMNLAVPQATLEQACLQLKLACE